MQVKWTQRALNQLNIGVNYGLREFVEKTAFQSLINYPIKFLKSNIITRAQSK